LSHTPHHTKSPLSSRGRDRRVKDTNKKTSVRRTSYSELTVSQTRSDVVATWRSRGSVNHRSEAYSPNDGIISDLSKLF